MSKAKLRGRCVEAFYFCSFIFLRESFEHYLASCPFDRLPEVQIDHFDEAALKDIRENLNSSTTAEELELIISKIGTELPDIQKAFKNFLEKTQEILLKPRILRSSITGDEFRSMSVDLPETENQMIVAYHGEYFWQRTIVPKKYSKRDWAILNLSKLMDDLNVNAITICEGCGRYFLRFSKRKKLYCSSSCASRSIAHKKYEELKKSPRKYKAHLKKYRKYSEERYKRLREIQYGPNVKIQKIKNRRKEG
ncbi:MAG: hypothetical protein ABSH06_17310 [Thermodesulfobacteriota bacterium]